MTAPAGSGVTNKGTTYADGSQVTSTNLNDIVDDAVFNTNAVDDSTIGLNSSTPKALFVKNQGIDTAQIADDAITFAKLADATLTSIKSALYPVGYILTTVTDYADSAAVVAAFGGTTWVRFGEGKALVGYDASDTDFDAIGSGTNTNGTTGAKTHTLTQAEMNHNHIWATTGGTGADLSIAVTAAGQRNDTFDGNGDSRELTSDGALSGTNHTDNNRALDSTSVTAHNNLQPYIVVYMWKRTV